MSLYDVSPMASRAQAAMAPKYDYTGQKAGTSMQKGFSSSAERNTAFQTSELGHGKPLALSAQTRKGVFSFEGEDSGSNPFQSR